jgi:MFS family permease
VVITVSGIAAFGGFVMYLLVSDGPFLAKGTRFKSNALLRVFKSKNFRAAAFGYFGHMWELYTFWAFLPLIIASYNSLNQQHSLNVSFWSFIIIGIGGLGCVCCGLLSSLLGSSKVVFFYLLISGGCCVSSALAFSAPVFLFLAFLLIWGIAVVGDSPQFSALAAKTAPREFIGTAFTIVNSIGFAITIVSIQFCNYLLPIVEEHYLYAFLAPGPALGLISLSKLLGDTNEGK